MKDASVDGSDGASIPLVTIAMPALNEAQHIAEAIRPVMPASGSLACELLVMDGGSSDATCAIVQALSDKDPRIQLIHNARRIQASALNLAARLAHPGSTYL
ncbi:glycosyltransferase, partial [Rhizobium sp. 18055]|uniref:glycosyltransferase n=1 Tax=Rhizobium sp. 18055 TaxID=2681403 RepID=UPI00135817D2